MQTHTQRMIAIAHCHGWPTPDEITERAAKIRKGWCDADGVLKGEQYCNAPVDESLHIRVIDTGQLGGGECRQ